MTPVPALFLSPEAPYPTIGGGALRAASLLEYLGRRYAVDLIVFRQPGAADSSDLIPPGLVRRVEIIDLPFHSNSYPARFCRNFGRLLRASPPLNDRFRGFGDAIDKLLKGRRYELALIEHFWCAPYFEQIALHSQRVILDLHNIESVLLAGCARAEGWPLSSAFRRFQKGCLNLERRWLPRFHFLLVPSDMDAKRILEIAPGCRVHVYPNTIPMVPEPVRPEEDAIAFSGNLGYHPNIAAVRFFRRQIWPKLRRRWPGLIWRLIGRNPAAVRQYVDTDPRIELCGPVDDAIEALAAAKVAVVPLLAGSGTRVKILEAWAAARAVVSTTLGAEGLSATHDRHLLLADRPDHFVEAVSSLLESQEKRDTLRRSGRALYEDEFTWESAWRKLARIGI